MNTEDWFDLAIFAGLAGVIVLAALPFRRQLVCRIFGHVCGEDSDDHSPMTTTCLRCGRKIGLRY